MLKNLRFFEDFVCGRGYGLSVGKKAARMRDSDRKGGSEGLAIPFELPQKWYRVFVITPAKSNTVVGEKHEDRCMKLATVLLVLLKRGGIVEERRRVRGKVGDYVLEGLQSARGTEGVLLYSVVRTLASFTNRNSIAILLLTWTFR